MGEKLESIDRIVRAHSELESLLLRHTGSYGAMNAEEFTETANERITEINDATVQGYSINLGFLISRKEKPYWEKEKITDTYDNIFDCSVQRLGVITQERRLRRCENKKYQLFGVEVVNVKAGQAVLYKYSEDKSRGLLLPQSRHIRALLDCRFLGYPEIDE
jgi:hypothetical protein